MRHDGFSDSEWADACAETLVLLDVAETLTPGPDLATACSELAQLPMDAQGRIRLASLWKKITTWSTVQEWRSQLAAIDLEHEAETNERQRGLLLRSVIAELAVSTCQSELSVNRQISDGYEITACLPAMTAALEAGQLSVPHGKALAQALVGAELEVLARIDAELTPLAIEHGWTPHQLRQAAIRLLLMLDPKGCAERAAARKRDEADVTYRTLGDGLGQLTAYGDDIQLRQVFDVIDAKAVELQGRVVGDDSDASGHVGVRRAAALIRTVLGDEQTDKPTVEVLVTMTAASLVGLCDTPAIVSSVGPLPAHVARQLATDGVWRRLITDPQTGHVIDIGQQSYVPSAGLRRIVLAEHRTCRFPGCARDAIHCDVDHRTNYGQPGGDTTRCNLGPLCRHHHNLKTFGLWTVDRQNDGSETWTSRNGVTRTTQLADYRQLLPEPDDPPPDDWDLLAPIIGDDQDFDPCADELWVMLDDARSPVSVEAHGDRD